MNRFECHGKQSEARTAIEAFDVKINEMKVLRAEIEDLVYDKTTKDRLNQIAASFQAQFKDWRSHALKTSKKSDLPQTLVKVIDRTVQYFDESKYKLGLELEKLQELEAKFKVREEADALLKRIRPMEGEYIRSFSSIKEGCRAWDCLITLVEDGTVGEQNIAEYGIDL